MAPEIVRRTEYEGRPVDIWSLGILLYALLCGCFPFRAKAYPDLYRRIARGTFAIPEELSAPVKDLLRQLLTVDADQRVTAHSALRHSWLQVQLVNSPNMDKLRQEMTVLISEKPADDLDEQVLGELTTYGMSRDEIIRLVLTKTHSSLASLYYLLLENVIAKRRLANNGMNKRVGPSGLGNFVYGNGTSAGGIQGVSVMTGNGQQQGSAQGGNNGQSMKPQRPKTAGMMGSHSHQQTQAPSYMINTPMMMMAQAQQQQQQAQVQGQQQGGMGGQQPNKMPTPVLSGPPIAGQPMQMYLPTGGGMPMGAMNMNLGMMNAYETMMHQQHQQQAQANLVNSNAINGGGEQGGVPDYRQYRPKSASQTRSSSTGTQRPLSAYAGRR
jgi:hypothetical protein